MKIEIRPREAFRKYLTRKNRWSCIVAHRRAGKTVAVLQDLLQKAFSTKRKGPPVRLGYVAPTRDQAKDIAWGYLKQYTNKIPGIETNESDLRITFPNKAQIRLYSGDSYERMRGLYFDGIVIDEMADISPQAWTQVMRPCLSDYQGWATFIGTPKGKNSFYKVHQNAEQDEEWFSMVLRASESGLIPDDELRDLKKNTPSDDFLQEYECDFSIGRPGAIYAADVARAEADGRIGPFPVDDSALVHTTWDLGAPQNTVVIYWQQVGLTTRIIDCDAGLALKTGERVSRMLQKGYNYGKHFLPHDGQNLQADNMSFSEKLMESGLANVVTLPRGPHNAEEKRIQAMTDMFSQIWFHEDLRGEGGLIDALDNYRRKENKLGGYVENVIVHDWASHFCFAPDTKVLTNQGVFPISSLPTRSKILTLTGWEEHTGGRLTKRNQKVVEVELTSGRKVICTPDHKWLTESGWISAEDLTRDTLLQKSSVIPRSGLMGGSLSSMTERGIIAKLGKGFIERFGNLFLVKFQKVAQFITSITTGATTGLKTLNVSTVGSTSEDTLKTLSSRGNCDHQAGRLSKKQVSGTNHQRESNGIGKTLLNVTSGKTNHDSLRSVSIAETTSKGLRGKGESRSIAATSAKTGQVRVVNVRECEQRIDVWCITVPKSGHFALADGVIVKNCDSFGYWSEAIKNRLIPEAHAMRSSKPAVQRMKISAGNL